MLNTNVLSILLLLGTPDAHQEPGVVHRAEQRVPGLYDITYMHICMYVHMYTHTYVYMHI